METLSKGVIAEQESLKSRIFEKDFEISKSSNKCLKFYMMIASRSLTLKYVFPLF